MRSGRLWKSLAAPDLQRAIARMEPPDRVMLATPERLDDVAYAFARIIDAKSPFTYEHSEGVAWVAAKLAAHVGFSEAEVREQRRAALLHDIGKLGISNRILGKPRKLTDEEFAKIQEHPALTYRVLMRVLPFRHLADLADLAASHHEKLDGTGYHRGLSAEDLDARPASSPSPTSSTPSRATAPTVRRCPSKRSSPSSRLRASLPPDRAGAVRSDL
ncbi:MAG: HD domain-containing protein [Actinobacteria bacterium]|nr:HD domain-containing protein [Actinomycetota bacterium]